jgi:SSS family solute:Na+ symporter
MNMNWLDWGIVAALFAFLFVVVFRSRMKKGQGVSDYLSANRCAGRYTLSIAEGMAGMGAMTIISVFQMYYASGFSAYWWSQMQGPVMLAISMSGWIIYRYRKTRSMTLAQFFEVRYSRKFRVFSGMLSFVAGVVNFGIMPAVSARFFIYFCGIPTDLPMFGMQVPSYPFIMAVLLISALAITYAGGQITIIITDFVQGLFSNIVFTFLLGFILLKFDWSVMVKGLQMAPEGASMIHPFHTGQATEFNFWFFLIIAFSIFYQYMVWQGQQGYNSSARTPHEARMSKVLGNFRGVSMFGTILLAPIFIYAVMHHPAYADIAANVNGTLATIDNEAIRTQVLVPVALSNILPVGLLGAFAAVMFAAFIGTTDSMLHSWGSIFIQDVVMPFRKKPFTPKAHMILLRLATVMVALIVFFFSLLFKQTTYIMYFATLTASIYTAGAGIVLICGLYWKRGTVAGAWAAVFTGSVLSVAGLVIRQIRPDFPVNEPTFFFIACIAATAMYFLFSLLRPAVFDMDRMLHRGKYEIKKDVARHEQKINWISRKLGITREFTLGDKCAYLFIIGWNGFWIGVFIVFNLINIFFDISDTVWSRYWEISNWLFLLMGVLSTIWFTCGGLLDIKQMFRDLKTSSRSEYDDGTVVDHRNLNEIKGK